MTCTFKPPFQFKDLLEAAGGKMNDIMSITVYVTNPMKMSRCGARREFFMATFPALDIDRGNPRCSPKAARRCGDQR
jgi:enamine deaminase RidA (YjgF/YER057c/UK114 family)